MRESLMITERKILMALKFDMNFLFQHPFIFKNVKILLL